MRTITTIYPNKAYTCRIHHCYVGEYHYEIFDCEWNLLKKSRVSEPYSLPEKKSLSATESREAGYNKTIEEIKQFYYKIGIAAPLLKSDWIPDLTHIDDVFYVKRQYDNLYSVIVSTGYSSDRHFTLVENLSYEKALDKAKEILSVCKSG